MSAASCSPISWDDLERVGVSRTDNREVPTVERRQLHEAESLCRSDDRGVHGTEGHVPIRGHELGDPDPVGRPNRFRDQVPCREVTKEPDLRLRTESGLEQIRHLGDNELWDDQRPGVTLEQGQAGFVVPIVLVDVGVEGTGIDDQRDRRASRRRISSMRRAVSRRPLRPALAAINLRRPAPRWDSMASRVIWETVVPRRSASWRSRASSSSGSFTVVLFMVCQHTHRRSHVKSRGSDTGTRSEFESLSYPMTTSRSEEVGNR